MNFGGFNTISFNGATLGGASGPVGGIDTLLEALRTYLSGLDSLSDLTDVYRRRPKKGASFPYLLISDINASPQINNSREFWDDQEYQFTVVSSDDAEVERLGESAFLALMPKGNPKLTFGDGYEIVRWPLYHGRIQENPARGPGNVNVWTWMFGYRISVGRLMP